MSLALQNFKLNHKCETIKFHRCTKKTEVPDTMISHVRMRRDLELSPDPVKWLEDLLARAKEGGREAH